jgi:hypothetical protein
MANLFKTMIFVPLVLCHHCSFVTAPYTAAAHAACTLAEDTRGCSGGCSTALANHFYCSATQFSWLPDGWRESGARGGEKSLAAR